MEKNVSLITQKRSTSIKHAALYLFITKGIDNVSVDDVCKLENISHGLFYHYYANLKDLITILFSECLDLFKTDIEKLKANNFQGIAFFDKLTEFVLNSSKKFDTKSFYMFFFFSIYQSKKANKILKNPAEVYYLVKNQIIYGQEKGEIIDGNPVQITLAYYYLLSSIVHQRLQFKGKMDKYRPTKEIVLNLLIKKGEKDV